jgi:hypothetical protein
VAGPCGVAVDPPSPGMLSLTVEDGRGRPPQAAARRAGLEVVEKLLTSIIYAANTAAWARSSRHAMVAPWTWRCGQQCRLNG